MMNCMEFRDSQSSETSKSSKNTGTDTEELTDRKKKRSNEKCNLSKALVISTGVTLVALLGMLLAIIIHEKRNIAQVQSLILFDSRKVYTYSSDNEKPSHLFTSENAIVALDIYKDESIIWMEENSSIVHFSMPRENRVVAVTNLWKAQAIAMDPVTNLLYLIDESSGTLNVFDMDRKYFTVVLSDLRKPHDLALDSDWGLMFVLLQYGSILKCNMDGTNKSDIIKDSELSAMTIDRKNTRVYWATKSCIHSSNYYGSQRAKIIASSSSNIPSLAFSSEQLFWLSNNSTTSSREYESRQSSGELSSCKIVNGTCREVTNREGDFKILKSPSYHSRDDNPCADNNDCAHLCLLSFRRQAVCACRIGWQLDSDLKSCKPTYTSIIYAENNFFRAKLINNRNDSFVDAIVPRKFYTQSLRYKSSIDFTYDLYGRGFFLSDDVNIYRYDMNSGSYNGDQEIVLTASQGYRLKDLVFYSIYDCLYYVLESFANVRTVGALCLAENSGRMIRKSVTNVQEGMFMVGTPFHLLYTPNWDEFFQSARTVDNTSMSFPSLLTKTHRRLRYYEMYKRVTLDVEGLRIYWISDTSYTKVKHTAYDGSHVRTFDVSFMENSTCIAVADDWMYIGNATGLWQFDKTNGSDPLKISGNGDEESHAALSGMQMYFDMHSLPSLSDTKSHLDPPDYYAVHIGV